MYLVAVDIGNSSTKVATCDVGSRNDRWLNEFELSAGDAFQKLAFDLEASRSWLWSVCSVNRQREKELAEWVRESRPNDRFQVIADSDIPLPSNVESRQQLGRDRLLAAWIATELHSRGNSKGNSKGPVIVVDAGTAVTIDYVDIDGIFQGGFIFPGVMSNLKILNHATDALPDLSQIQRSESRDLAKFELGQSTTKAILSGVNQSQIFAMRGMVEAIGSKLNQKPAVYLTGGGIHRIRSAFPDDWQHVPDLVLQGAREIGRAMFGSGASD